MKDCVNCGFSLFVSETVCPHCDARPGDETDDASEHAQANDGVFTGP